MKHKEKIFGTRKRSDRDQNVNLYVKVIKRFDGLKWIEVSQHEVTSWGLFRSYEDRANFEKKFEEAKSYNNKVKVNSRVIKK